MPRKKRRVRRRRGEGYISYDERRNKWRATIPLLNGRSSTKYFADEQAADAWRAAQVYAVAHPEPPPDPSPAILDALAELIADATYLREATQANYRIYAGHINNAIGGKLAKEVTAYDIRAMDRVHRETMAGATANAILTLLSTMYERLIALELVTKNPVRMYRKITPARARRGKPLRDPIILTVSETRKLIAALEGDAYRIHIIWLLILGLRVGELRGLRWENVTDEHIAVTEQRTHRDRYTPAEIKTEETIGEGRYLPTIHQLTAMLPRGDGLVFPSKRGGSFDENTLRTHLNKACAKAEIRRIRIHDTRHTGSANILRLGCPSEYVAYYLGHKQGKKSPLVEFAQTLHYARPNADALRPYVESWAALLLGPPDLVLDVSSRKVYNSTYDELQISENPVHHLASTDEDQRPHG